MDNNDDFIKDWLEGKVPPEELKSKKEKGDPTVNEFDELITRSAQLKVPETETEENAWAKISAKINEAPKQEGRVVKMNRWIPLSIAASVSVILITFFMFSEKTVATQFAETRVIELPDGSEVTLNADSKIAFSRIGWSDNRAISLEGEAFFQVVKGSSFTVETEHGTVTVLGTSFNVNTRALRFDVSCFTGKVKVASGESEVMLTKGLFTKLEGKRLIDPAVFNDAQTTWRTGDFFFDGAPLSVVMDELERQFAIDITFSGDGSRLYTGYFSNKNLDQALEMVFKPMSLSYQLDNKKVIVK